MGSTIIVIHAPKEGDIKSIQELNDKIFESGIYRKMCLIFYKYLINFVNFFEKRFCLLYYAGDCSIYLHCVRSMLLNLKTKSLIHFKNFYSKFVVPRYGKTNVAVYIFICSSIGSLSVMCCKGLGLSVRESFSNEEKSFFNTSSLFFALALLVCITVQVIVLKNFKLPVYYL